MATFGTVIKEIRKKRKLTQKMLSEDICSQSVLSRIEHDEELPNVVVMQKLCARLGVTIDQILQLESEDVQCVSCSFEKMAYYFRHKMYQELFTYLQAANVEKHLYLDTDWQRYYYYLGSCQLHLNQDYEKAAASLQKGLAYTYKAEKLNISDLEIQVMSCLGSVYGYLGKIEQAQHYLRLSLFYFKELPKERVNAELTKIFYNYAYFLWKNGQSQNAETYINQGIQWARDKTSFYYLAELFTLKYELLCQQQRHFEAQEFYMLAQKLNDIESGKI
ncbi:helix-turn-helix domain-containing protein [Enterococcus faecalis]